MALMRRALKRPLRPPAAAARHPQVSARLAAVLAGLRPLLAARAVS